MKTAYDELDRHPLPSGCFRVRRGPRRRACSSQGGGGGPYCHSRCGAQALARAYVDRAHRTGLAIGQKNAAEIAATAHDDWGFDFAITEECGVFEECGSYAAAYGTHVLQIEYPDALADVGMSFDDVCADPDRAPLTILRDPDLVARGEPGYLYDRCD